MVWYITQQMMLRERSVTNLNKDPDIDHLEKNKTWMLIASGSYFFASGVDRLKTFFVRPKAHVN